MAEHKHATTKHEEPKKGELSAELHDLTAAVKGDLTKLAGSKADKAISHWQTTLEGLGGAPLKAIAGDLGKLKALVADDEPDGAKIGKNLAGLSEKVAKLAEEQSGVIGTALKSLSGALHKGSESLAAKA